MEIIIPVHSLVDVITNSSSEMYTWASEDSVKHTKNLIKEIMESLDVAGSVEDYFDITMEIDPEWVESVKGALLNRWEQSEEEITNINNFIETGGAVEKIRNKLDCADYPIRGGTILKIKSVQTNKNIDLQDAIEKIFVSDDCEQGV